MKPLYARLIVARIVSYTRAYARLAASALLTVCCLTFGPGASALTDYSCLNNCSAKGMSYGYCHSNCSTADEVIPVNNDIFGQALPKQEGQTDFACLRQCTGQGYLYRLCQKKCSY